MSSTITGLGSGFDINSWVSQLVAVKQSSTLTPLQTKLNTLNTKSSAITSLKSKFSSLQSSLQTFTKTIYNSSSDMWTNTTIKSSNEAFATASSSGNVSAASVNLSIEQIATATTARSIHSLGAISKDNIENAKFVNLANGQAKSGTFSMFLNGKEYGIDIKEDFTLKNVMDEIAKVSNNKIQASVDLAGNFSIKAYKEAADENGNIKYVLDESATLALGSGGDTSNLASALKLHNKEGEYSYSSAYVVSTFNSSIAMASSESGLSGLKFYDENGQETTSGKIVINGVEFEVNDKTSLNDLISKINGNSEAKVKASYDSLSNDFILTSTQTGQSNISLSSEGTNLLNVLGLTTGEGEDEIIATGSQELGKNAIAYINGNKVISTSNTITGESSGIANLSITIKKPTSEYSNNKEDDKSVTLDIEPDYSRVKDSLNSFVKAYNDVISTAKKMTASDGDIGRDAALNSIISKLRNITSSVSENDGAFSMLAQIGIDIDKDDLSKLTIDSSKLDKALNENFDSVKKLLSDGYKAKEDNGLFDTLLADVSSVLDVERGYFANQSESVQNQIKSMNTRIERANQRISAYEIRITNQFNKMDATIQALNAQLSTFSAYMG